MRQASAQTAKDQTPPKEEEVEKVEIEAEDEVDVVVEDDEAPVEDKVEEKKPEAKAEPEKKEEDEAPALRRRLEELKRSEEIAVRRAAEYQRQQEEALAARQKAETEVTRFRLENEQSQLEAITAAMAAAKAEADGAQQLIEAAIANADPKGQAEAYRALARAESNLSRLSDGKDELEYRISVMRAEAKKAPEPEKKIEKEAPREPEKVDVIETLPVPDRAKEWLREHREFAEDARKNAKLQVAHWDALDEGHKEFSTPYFAAIERILGVGKQEKQVEVIEDEEEVEDEPVRKPVKPEQRRSAIVSAPVSRDSSGPGSDTPSKTQVRLTKEQAEFAKMAGITPAEYGKQLLKLQEMKRKGEIQ